MVLRQHCVTDGTYCFGYQIPDYLLSPQGVTNEAALGNGTVRGVDYGESGAGIQSPKVERHCLPIFENGVG
jgi:hypothetical protein